MKQRKWTAEEKLALVLEGLKEKRSVADICMEHKISQTLYYKWRDRFFEGGKRSLINGTSDDNHYKAEIEKLQKIIGKQAIQIEILKKQNMATLGIEHIFTSYPHPKGNAEAKLGSPKITRFFGVLVR